MTTFAKATFNAAQYAIYRPSYPQSLYDTVLRYHKGAKDTCLDLGCGHGLISQKLSPHFKRVIATDPSKGMIEQARKKNADHKNVEFEVATAEYLPFVQDKSVDLVVAGQAAHWFDYNKVWPELRRLVKKGGTLAFWGYKDPVIVGAPKASAILDRWSYDSNTDRAVGPYWEPGRAIVRNQLRDIQPPRDIWTDEQRIEYEPDPARKHNGTGTLFVEKAMPVKGLEMYMRTYSSWHNWQAAHPEAEGRSRVEGGSGDLIDETVDEMMAAEGWKDDQTQIEMEWGSVIILARMNG